jgi:hypothetical protein
MCAGSMDRQAAPPDINRQNGGGAPGYGVAQDESGIELSQSEAARQQLAESDPERRERAPVGSGDYLRMEVLGW